MKNTIYRGKTIIGSITCPSEAGAPAFGMEVLAVSAFPDPEADDPQFESFEQGERYLNKAYEAHCRAQGIEPEPMPAPVAAYDAEAAYYAREAELEQAELAAFEADMDAQAQAPSKPAPEIVVNTDADDFPF